MLCLRVSQSGVTTFGSPRCYIEKLHGNPQETIISILTKVHSERSFSHHFKSTRKIFFSLLTFLVIFILLVFDGWLWYFKGWNEVKKRSRFFQLVSFLNNWTHFSIRSKIEALRLINFMCLRKGYLKSLAYESLIHDRLVIHFPDRLCLLLLFKFVKQSFINFVYFDPPSCFHQWKILPLTANIQQIPPS